MDTEKYEEAVRDYEKVNKLDRSRGMLNSVKSYGTWFIKKGIYLHVWQLKFGLILIKLHKKIMKL